MSTAAAPAPAPAPPAKRYALSLPPGSVRAIHVLGIVALVCAMILLPGKTDDAGNVTPLAIPPYLIYLLFIMLGHYFAAHGVTINTRDDPSPSPLFLPGGTVRFLIVLALCGCIGWMLYSQPDALKAKFIESLRHLQEQPYLPLTILGGFFLGITVAAIIRRINKPSWWQDIEAWLSLVALIGIGISAVIHLIIERNSDMTLMLPTFNACLGGVLAFYFGVRS